MTTRGYSGKFTPKHPEKYVGNVNEIFYRSLLERTMMKKFDDDVNVLKWNSEEVVINYVSPIDHKTHRYFVDFYVEYIDINGKLNKELIEVKPYSQVIPPKKSKRGRPALYEIAKATYLINRAKWAAAQKYCEGTGVKFAILTEKQIRPDKRDK